MMQTTYLHCVTLRELSRVLRAHQVHLHDTTSNDKNTSCQQHTVLCTIWPAVTCTLCLNIRYHQPLLMKILCKKTVNKWETKALDKEDTAVGK